MSKDNYKITKEHIELIKMGIDEFIDYTNSNYGCYFKYYSNLEFYDKLIKEKYKGDAIKFYSDNAIDIVSFTVGLECYNLLEIANNVKNDIKNIHNNVVKIISQHISIINPINSKSWLRIFKFFCYDENYKLLSLEEQDKRFTKYYPSINSKNPIAYYIN